jgi:signal transduction histidine kinase
MRPVWLGDELFLARRVSMEEGDYIQGCWLDWAGIRAWLLEDARDLLPRARLVPVRSEAGVEPTRMMAGLPVRLVPGALPEPASQGLSPVQLTLLVAWGFVAVAGVAVGSVLHAAISLSERRGAFVSAVTHEMRTPLTTFQMYTEMLAEGMVEDEAKQLRYLRTLRVEAERLAHLVENVLAYARLERGRKVSRMDVVTLGGLVEDLRERFAERARHAGMRFVVEAGNDECFVRADTSAVERILFNLIDNACKYARNADDKRVHLVLDRVGSFARLRVWDHGPGISEEQASRLFVPFSKSAHDAAHSAPGVGLGLALSRRLARRMGGDLVLDRSVKAGACFVLLLPVS